MMHKKLTMLFSASVLCGVLAAGVPVANAQDINYNLPPAEEIQQRKDNRRNLTVSERVGRRIMSAFELYSEKEDIKGAIVELEAIEPREAFDQAYVDRFLGNLYAADNRIEDAYKRVNRAADADVLGWSDQASALKLAADLSLQLEDYRSALNYYGKWLQFTGEGNGDVFLRIANSYYELRQFDKVIRPADLAIQYYEKPNKNPYVLKVASYYERKMYNDAIKVLESGLEIFPAEKSWWNQLGMIYMLEEQLDKALQTLEIAYLAGYFEKENQFKALIQLYSNNGISYDSARLMVNHLNSGDIEKTARNYQSAASNFEMAREYSRAAEMYGLAAKLADEREDRAEYYRKKGTAHLRAQEYTEAAQSYLEAIDQGFDELGPVYMSLTEAYFYQNNFNEALKYVQEAQKYDGQRRNARSWESYIRSKASNRGISL
ncbi:tetratricopeptide repeat protein [Pseudidiomarina sp. E22-M8]|uniref:tetratricopeptide repeat protein n=1 Tax=Pseudidiomarina sp. E22-M8 TaxID=3424768 RepID=UPI00403C3B5E